MKNLLGAVLILFVTTLVAQTPPDISLIFYLDENSENGTTVGTVTATDPDGDVLTFTIASGNGLGAFAIGSSTGTITVADESQLDFTVNPSFSLMVEANDGNGGVTTADVTININDVPLGLFDAENKVRVYPNPVSETLFLDLSGVDFNKQGVSLHSVDGRQISILPKLLSSSKMEFDLRNLNTGVYLLKIIGDEDQSIQRRIFVR
ncbi:MAG: T9SS type A sorting domain-containing protein [Cyclobacteriaceae bacterium]